MERAIIYIKKLEVRQILYIIYQITDWIFSFAKSYLVTYLITSGLLYQFLLRYEGEDLKEISPSETLKVIEVLGEQLGYIVLLLTIVIKVIKDWKRIEIILDKVNFKIFHK